MDAVGKQMQGVIACWCLWTSQESTRQVCECVRPAVMCVVYLPSTGCQFHHRMLCVTWRFAASCISLRSWLELVRSALESGHSAGHGPSASGQLCVILDAANVAPMLDLTPDHHRVLQVNALWPHPPSRWEPLVPSLLRDRNRMASPVYACTLTLQPAGRHCVRNKELSARPG